MINSVYIITMVECFFVFNSCGTSVPGAVRLCNVRKEVKLPQPVSCSAPFSLRGKKKRNKTNNQEE